MKNLTQFLFMLLCICLPATAFADANKDKDDDSKYLAGAVPEVDGKVVFTKAFPACRRKKSSNACRLGWKRG